MPKTCFVQQARAFFHSILVNKIKNRMALPGVGHTDLGDRMMKSIWDGVQMPGFSSLEGELRTDVLVIGGGLAGLLCAWRLKQAGVDCRLVEQGRIMGGVSGRTTAKLTAQHGAIYSRLVRQFGPERAGSYWQANRRAVEALAELAREGNCDFQEQDSILFAKDSGGTPEEELRACQMLGIPVRWEEKLPLPFPTAGGLVLPGQGQFHPLKLAAHVAKGLPIFEHTKVLEFIGNGVRTEKGTVTAERIIVATHFPMLNKHGGYFLKLYQQRSYVLALENAPEIGGMYLECGGDGLSLRSAGEFLLLGGGGHRTGKAGRNWVPAEKAAERYFPQAKAAARWATQDCMSLDGMPYIGQYSRGTPELLVATGFGKWGMSSSMVAASVLTDRILGREDPVAELFSPRRSMLHRQLFRNAAESAVNLLRPAGPRCPHLGCALEWNKEERSWDCPCHGSRFDERGGVLDGPATGDMKHPPEM